MTEQATPPTDAEQVQTLRMANAMLRVCVGEMEARWQAVTVERDKEAKEAEYWRGENRAIRDAAARTMEEALTYIAPAAALERERNNLKHELERARAALQAARIYVDRMTIQVGPVAHDGIAPAKRVLALIDAALTGAAGEGV